MNQGPDRVLSERGRRSGFFIADQGRVLYPPPDAWAVRLLLGRGESGVGIGLFQPHNHDRLH
jgi:hypothetical protein